MPPPPRNNFLKFFFFISYFLTTFIVFSQEQKTLLLKSDFHNSGLYGECIINKSINKVEDNIVKTIFYIEIPKNGNYYLSAWIDGFRTEKGLENFNVYIDNQKIPAGILKITKTGWQKTMLSNSKTKNKLTLTKGKHSIAFTSKIPYVPNIEFIRLAKNYTDAKIPDSKYEAYITKLKQSKLAEKYLLRKPDSLSVGLKKVLPNPNGNYLHELEFGFNYTYYTRYFFKSGQHVTFETKDDDPCSSDPVMHLFNADDPVNKGSWGNDDGGECSQAKISVTINYTGFYYLFVRGYWPSTAQTTDLYYNGHLRDSDIPINCNARRCDHTLTEQLNYFTCYLTGDSRIWIESYEPGLNGKILGYNDDYNGNGDFNWGHASRVKKAFNKRIWNVFVSAYSSYNPTGQADLYTRVKNSNIMSSFPNLKADDAMQSAPASNAYNCISWAGGIVDHWYWPPTDYTQTWYDPDDLTAFDNFFGNKTSNGTPGSRKLGESWTYSRSGANSNNWMIALWANSNGYTHASVRQYNHDYANNNPHGYDSESKPGGLMRTFHPKNALSGNDYGNIVKYYRWTGTILYKTKLLPILNVKGKKIIVKFNKMEQDKINNKIKKLPKQTIEEFNQKYNSWKSTWELPKVKLFSNPRKYAESQQYNILLKYCLDEGKAILPLVFKKFEQGDYFVRNLIEDLTFGEYKFLMEEVRKDRINNLYDKNGIFIEPSNYNGWMNYIKKILAISELNGPFKNLSPDKKELQQKTEKNDKIKFMNYPNPFNPTTQIKYNIPSNNRITVKIFDILGKEIVTLIDNENQSKGWHTITWNGNNFDNYPVSSGIYFCRLYIENKVKTIKLLLNR